MFKKMEYVLEIYKQKSFTKAAEKLFISQPCLSAAVKEIEQEIGYPLFERRYSGLTLTEIGSEYIRTAEQLCALKNDFVLKINGLENLEFGKIVIGGSNYITSYVLPRILREFSLKYPKIEVEFVEGNSIELENKLDREEIDVLIDSYEPKSTQIGCSLLTENIILAVPKSFSVNGRLERYQTLPGEIQNINSAESISIREFKNEKFVLLKNGHNMRSQANEVFKKAEIEPQISFCLDQLSTSYSLAASGNGVCFVTDTMFKFHDYSNETVLYRIKECSTRTLFAARKKNSFLSPAMEKFIETAKASICQMQ